MKVYEVMIDENNLLSGVNAISLVESPAIERDFIALSKDEKISVMKMELTEVDEARGVLMGAVLIPNKPIVRTDEHGEKFYIVFSKDTIRQASELFLMRGRQGETSEDHMISLDGNFVVESWIKEDVDKDKSVMFGLDAPLGTWFVAMKIGDPELYKKAKEGNLNGFSIEGFFTPALREHLSKIGISEEDPLVQKIRDAIHESEKED